MRPSRAWNKPPGRTAFESISNTICWAVQPTMSTVCSALTTPRTKQPGPTLCWWAPKWDQIKIDGGPQDKDGLMRLRHTLDVYAGLRPARGHPALTHATPFREGLAEQADVMVVRELCGGAFFAQPRGIEPIKGGGFRAFDTNLYTTPEIERIARVAFALARRRRGRVTSIDKANVMQSYVLWRHRPL